VVLVWFDGGEEGQCQFLQQSRILVAKKEVDYFLGGTGCLPSFWLPYTHRLSNHTLGMLQGGEPFLDALCRIILQSA
jgi:hypothetical protein